jgi:hypothetical protein
MIGTTLGPNARVHFWAQVSGSTTIIVRRITQIACDHCGDR